MRILLTGAGGFIGSHLAKTLALFADNELRCPHEREMDLRDAETIEELVRAFQPEIVLHLAAKTEVALSFEDYADFQRVNYLGTVLLAEANMRHNLALRQFVFASTMETYGWPGHGSARNGISAADAFDEDTPQNPIAPYAVAKLACEKYLAYLAQAYDFPVTVLRQTNTYGRTHNDFFVMERIISQMIDGDICLLGEKDPLRNFLFIDDLVALYQAVIGNEAAIGETFVTGPDNAISIHDLAAKCADLLKWEGTIEWGTIQKRPGEVYYLNSNPAKAERVLGWKPETGLDKGILLTAERMRITRIARSAIEADRDNPAVPELMAMPLYDSVPEWKRARGLR